jgi:hypothetical protein
MPSEVAASEYFIYMYIFYLYTTRGMTRDVSELEALPGWHPELAMVDMRLLFQS